MLLEAFRNESESLDGRFCLGLALIAALALPFLYAPQRPYHTCAVATWVLTLHAAIAPLIVPPRGRGDTQSPIRCPAPECDGELWI